MKYLNGKYYVEVKDKKYKIHPSENIILREREQPKSLRTQYQIQNNTKIRRNQKVIKDDKGKLTVKPYPKKEKPQHSENTQKIIQCPSCYRNAMVEYDEYYQCEVCDVIMNKTKKEMGKKVFRQSKNFSTRLPYGEKKLKEIYDNMSQTKYKSYQEMIDKLQLLKGKTKLKYRQNYSNVYSEMQWKRSNNNFQFEDRFARNKKGIMLIMLEALMLIKFFQTKPYLKNENIDYFDIYYVIILNKLEKEKNETSFKLFQ